MLQEQTNLWSSAYINAGRMAYPAEYVVRIFKGCYPRLYLSRGGGYRDCAILDVGCGDGRHLSLFASLGFADIAGCEVSQEVINVVRENIHSAGLKADLRVGINSNLGFENERFDFLLSWNVCYYLDDNMDFSANIIEYSRVLKPGGILIFSIPCKDCFVYKDGIEKDGFITIRNDWFKIRNGSVQKVFQGEDDIKMHFSNHFKDFVFGKIDDDCFGLAYKWHIGICKKR